MIEFFSMNSEQLDWRVLRQTAAILQQGGLVVYPTDASYALGCLPQAKAAVERICHIRQLRRTHDFTLLCAELKVATDYVSIDNRAFALIKRHTPGPYTFILPAQRQVPAFIKELHRDKENMKTMGIRIPNHPVLSALLELLGQPLLNSTLQLPGADVPLNAEDLHPDTFKIPVDVVIEAGECSLQGTTVVDLTGEAPVVLREGVGDWTG